MDNKKRPNLRSKSKRDRKTQFNQIINSLKKKKKTKQIQQQTGSKPTESNTQAQTMPIPLDKGSLQDQTVDIPLGQNKTMDIPLQDQNQTVDIPLGQDKTMDIPLGQDKTMDIPFQDQDKTMDIPFQDQDKTIGIPLDQDRTIPIPTSTNIQEDTRAQTVVLGNKTDDSQPPTKIDSTTSSLSQEALFAPGSKILHYEVRKTIGQGGMGEVFLARDTNLKRDVAIKTLYKNLATQREYLLRFQQEAQAVAQIRHPNVVQIFGLHEVQQVHFFTMEFINDAQTLEEHIEKRGFIKQEEVVDLLINIVKGLAAIHEKNIVHRDIKPANIMMDKGIPRITDFGIVHWKDIERTGSTTASSGSQDLTGHGRILGTPYYLAPECIKGERASKTSDIYSLGVMVYEMLTGKKPFKGNTMQETITKQLKVNLPPVHKQMPNISPELSNIVHKMLVKEHKNRIQNTREILKKLTELQNLWKSSEEIQVRQQMGLELSNMMVDTVKEKKSSSMRRVMVGGVIFAVLIFLGYMVANMMAIPTQKPKNATNRSLADIKWRKGEEARGVGELMEKLDFLPGDETEGLFFVLNNYKNDQYIFLSGRFLENASIELEEQKNYAFQGLVQQTTIDEEPVLYLQVDDKGRIPWEELTYYIIEENLLTQVDIYEEDMVGMTGNLKGTILYCKKNDKSIWVLLGNQENIVGVDIQYNPKKLSLKTLRMKKLRIGDSIEARGVIAFREKDQDKEGQENDEAQDSDNEEDEEIENIDESEIYYLNVDTQNTAHWVEIKSLAGKKEK